MTFTLYQKSCFRLFYPFGKLSAIFIALEIVVFKLFQFGSVLKCVVWERVKLCLQICWWLIGSFLSQVEMFNVIVQKKKNLNPFPNKAWFLRVCSTSLLKTLREKEKLLVTSNFSFSHCVFYPFGKLSGILIKIKIVVCKLFQFGRV